MWTPISIDKFVKIHLKKNPNENEKVLRVRIEAALDDYSDDWEDDVLCNLNRADQTNDKDFKCYSYKKL